MGNKVPFAGGRVNLAGSGDAWGGVAARETSLKDAGVIEKEM